MIFVAGEGQVRGSVFAHGKHYAIRGEDATSQVAVEIDQSAFPPEACDRMQDGGTLPDDGSQPVPDAAGDTGAVIDVLVVYTASAKNAEGGVTNMNNLISLAVAETNTSYANSGISPRLNLVHAEEIAYTETGDWNQDLDRLRGTGDGYMDSVHPLRDAYRADVVVMVINDNLYCGMAYLTANATTAFALVDNDCATGYYSFGHEIGHLQAARHDMYVDPTLGSPYDYNHGNVDLTNRQRTVMAYNTKCSDTAPGTYCTRLPYWSNPGVNYPSTSVPTGTATRENNALVLNNTAATVANFRQSMIPSTLTVLSTYPTTGVPITVNLPDTGGLASGTTAFTRSYASDAIVTLTAPTPNGDGNNFANWTGCDAGYAGGAVCTVAMSANKTVTANYTRVAPTSFALWSKGGSGQAAIWELDPVTAAIQNSVWLNSSVGIGSPWLASSLAGAGSVSYVLWTRSDYGLAAVWKVDPVSGAVSSGVYLYGGQGIGSPWQATSYAHLGASSGKVLWTRNDTGQAALWTIDPDTGAVSSGVYVNGGVGIGAPWQAVSYTHVSDGVGYVLWTRSDTGVAALWKVDPATGAVASGVYVNGGQGIGSPWQATSYTHLSDASGEVLWTRSDTGQAALWTINPGTGAVEKGLYLNSGSGIGAGWQATSYTR